MDPGFAALLGAGVGGLLTGGAAVVAQVLAARVQANAARDDWNRKQVADRLASLGRTYLDILTAAHSVENAVDSWQSGTLTATPAHATIGAGNRALEQAGLVVMLESGPTDPIVGLITRLRVEAERYGDLYLVSRTTPATADEKREQAAMVSAAADELAAHLHQRLRQAAETAR